jgi:thioredoxin-like negative regulator of GroEL
VCQHVLALLLALSCSAIAVSLSDIEEKGAVQVLTSASWDSFLADVSKPLVILHYAPWCGHCKRLLPDFEVASRRCASAVIFAKVDCTAQSALCSGVNAYPHIKIHVVQHSAWEAREYDGEHSADALELLCSRLSSPKFTALASASELEQLSAAFAIDAGADAADMSLFQAAANELYHVSHASCVVSVKL